LVAFADLLTAANQAINRDGTQLRLEVSANFKAGSFGIELSVSQQLISQLKEIFSGHGATAVSNAYTIMTLIGFTGGGLIGVLRAASPAVAAKPALTPGESGQVRETGSPAFRPSRRSPGHDAPEVIHVVQPRPSCVRLDRIHQLRDALFDAQPRVWPTHIRSHPAGRQ